MLTAPHSTGTDKVACNTTEMCVQVNCKVHSLQEDVYGFVCFNCLHDVSVRHQEINLGNSQDNLHKAGSNIDKTSWLKWKSAAVTLHPIPAFTHTNTCTHTTTARIIIIIIYGQRWKAKGGMVMHTDAD